VNLILWISAAVFALDQAAKLVAIRSLILNRPVAVIDGLFNLTLVFNTGAAFGILVNRTVILAGISFVTIATLVVIGIVYAREQASFRAALGLILGGAAGNLFDRVARGYVVDYLDFFAGRYHWPAFNVADSCICVGTFMLLLYFFLKK